MMSMPYTPILATLALQRTFEFGTTVILVGIGVLLLEPLRENWFTDEEGKGLGSTLVDPLVENVLDPVEAAAPLPEEVCPMPAQADSVRVAASVRSR